MKRLICYFFGHIYSPARLIADGFNAAVGALTIWTRCARCKRMYECDWRVK